MSDKTKMRWYLLLIVIAVISVFTSSALVTKVELIICFALFGLITLSPNETETRKTKR